MREQWTDDRFRARFINSLTGPKSVTLIGTRSSEGRSNCAIFSSVMHLGANPSLIGFIVRPDSVARDTLSNIVETQYYTMNSVSFSFKEQAHQTSARYSPEESEFSACGLNEEYRDDFQAPFVKESKLKWSMKLVRKVDIPENGTHLIIGEVLDVYFPESIWDDDGHLHLKGIDPAVVIGLDEYANLEDTCRYSYAKVDQPLRVIPFSKKN